MIHLTNREQKLIGKEVLFQADVSYGGVFGKVYTDTRATIVDFAKQSGDPIVLIYLTDTKVIVPFKYLKDFNRFAGNSPTPCAGG